MASGEAEPLQYTTTVLRVSIHCEGCKKKVKKVLHSIEGVYKVTVDAAQHRVTVTGNVAADALVRRLHKAGKQAALWASSPAAPAPAPMEAKKKPEDAAPAAAPAPAAVAESAAQEEAAGDAKPKDKQPEAHGKPKDKGSEPERKKPDKGEAEAIAAEPTEKKGSPAEPPAKQDAVEDAGAEDPGAAAGGGKKGKKNKKNKPKEDGGEEEPPSPAAPPPEKKPPLQQQQQQPSPVPFPERPHGGAASYPYYAAAAAQPAVLSYNVAHPSSSVSYYAPTPAVPMHHPPMAPPAAAMHPPPQMVPYGYPPPPYAAAAAAMVPVPAEYLYGYGPPGTMRSSPPQEAYNNMFNEDNANSCTLM